MQRKIRIPHQSCLFLFPQHQAGDVANPEGAAAVAQALRLVRCFFRISLIALGWLTGLLFATLLTVVRAEKLATVPPPPMALPAQVTVYVGESTKIPLRAVGRSANTARFLIRTRPVSGNLGEIKPNEPGSAYVIYTHKKSAGIGMDQFTYAVQAVDSPVSAPARVTIQIVERPSVFDAPRMVDFGTFFAGEEITKPVIISNQGGGILVGIAKADGGWEVVEGAEYRLGPGEAARVVLRLRAAEARSYTGALRFSHDPEAAVYLSGVARDPFVLSPETLEFDRATGVEGTRKKVHLVNQTPHDIFLDVRNGAALALPDRVLLPAESELSLPARADAFGAEGGEGCVEFVSGEIKRTLAYRVFPTPGKIVFEPAEGLDFGTFDRERPPSLPLVLYNIGGLPVNVELTSPQRFEIEGPRVFTLQPGEKHQVLLSPSTTHPGEFNEALSVRAGRQLVSVALRGTVVGAFNTEADEAFSSPNSRPSATGEFSHKGREVKLPRHPILDEPNPSFTEVELVEVGPDFLRFRFQDPTPGVHRHVVELRSVGVGEDGLPKISWSPLPGASVRDLEDGKKEVLVRGLTQGVALRTRITSLDVAGKSLAHSAMFYISSPAPSAAFAFSWRWLLVPLFLGILVWLACRIRAGRQARLDEDLARIQKLEK
jgi:hypothetical protein